MIGGGNNFSEFLNEQWYYLYTRWITDSEESYSFDTSQVREQLMAMGFDVGQIESAIMLTKSTDTQTLIDAILG